ncbi:MAG: hypothetical protein WD208_05575 [Dehalococcoidia bacterium]
MRKRYIGILSVGVALLAIAVLFIVDNNGTGAQQYPADAYRDGQDQFIQLIGEEEFAKFEHNHPPLDCTDAEWQEDPLSCSEAWIHRSEIAEIRNPSDVREGTSQDSGS